MQTNDAYEQAAVTAAEQWLALVDAGDYAEAWDDTSPVFKTGVQTASLFSAGVSEQRWQSSIAALHAELGRAVSRSLQSKERFEGLPGEPDGEFLRLRYETSFDREANGFETLVLTKESNGEWRVSGYRIRLGASDKVLSADAQRV